jgi:predicted LPLAT superfamily acyltransferase
MRPGTETALKDPRRDPAAQGATAPDWTVAPERSTARALRAMVWIALTLGRRTARLLLYPICLYFYLLSPGTTAASRTYLGKVLGRKAHAIDRYRHYHTFAATLLDRIFLLHGQYDRFDVRTQGEEALAAVLAEGRGCFLLGAHMGSFEVIRAVGRHNTRAPISLVMYAENARQFNSVLAAINPHLSLQVIGLGKVDSMLKVEAALQRGEIAGMLGDRTIQGEGTLACPFLGTPAQFPIGPFRLAAMLHRPVILMFGLYRGGNRYDVCFERLVDNWDVPRGERERLLEQSLRRYVERLEHHCRTAPYNWFNFYDFWK